MKTLEEIFEYQKNQPELLTAPEPFENEYPEFATCSICHEEVLDWVEYKNYIICSECREQRSHRTLDEIVYFMRLREKSMKETMNSIGKLSISVRQPYK